MWEVDVDSEADIVGEVQVATAGIHIIEGARGGHRCIAL